MKRDELLNEMFGVMDKKGFDCKLVEKSPENRNGITHFEATDKNGKTFKAMFTYETFIFKKRWRNEDIHIVFFHKNAFYFYSHNKLLEKAEKEGDSFCSNGGNDSWIGLASWTKGNLTNCWRDRLKPYKLAEKQ